MQFVDGFLACWFGRWRWAVCIYINTLQELKYFLPKTTTSIISVHILGIGVYEKICFQSEINTQYNWLQNNTVQLYFILGRAELHWNFSSKPKDGSDIHRFSNRKWVSTMCTVGNLWISEASLSKLEKFQHSLALLNIKYNCAVLFWSQLYWVFIYDSKYIFS